MDNILDSIDQLLTNIDISFKWILILINFITLTVIYIHKKMNPKPRDNHILFIIAHPDDQCMFFRPTISNLKELYIVHVLCLTGQGTEREKQLIQCCKYMGVDEVKCIGDKDLVDGMKEEWCLKTIQGYVRRYVNQKNIKAIFTFDKKGVSGHKNHISINQAMKALEVKSDTEGSIKIYYLESVNILRKYSGVLQVLVALLKTYSWIDISPISAYRSMSKHKSQFVWYRRLWIFFSRYEFVNTYKRELIKIREKQQSRQQKGEGEGMKQQNEQVEVKKDV